MDKKSKRSYPPYDDAKFYDIAQVASSNDCTGLEPTPPISESDAESYSTLLNVPHSKGEVNNFLQNIKKTKNNDDTGHQ